MTGYQSKKDMAQDKLDSMEREALKLALEVLEDLPGFRADIDNAITAIKKALAQPAQEPWPEEPFGHMAGGVQPPQRTEERNFCPRCGKRTADLTTIHTCTPPQENT